LPFLALSSSSSVLRKQWLPASSKSKLSTQIILCTLLGILVS
jgi:hypothetical protein